MLINKIKKIYCFINNKILFNDEKKKPTKKEQDAFFKQFSNPKDDYEASFNKYLCVSFYYYNILIRFCYNFISLNSIIWFYIFFRIKGRKLKVSRLKHKNTGLIKASKKIPTTDIFPDELKAKYDSLIEVEQIDYDKIFLLSPANKIFLKAVKKHPLHFHYLLILLIRLSQQCYYIYTYNAKTIFTYVCEREFSDPLLSLLSEKLNISYEGFMHGDYLCTIDKAFMRYSCYWVWDQHYLRMFKAQKCNQKMKIYTPLKLKGITQALKNTDEYTYFATYYLSSETKESIQRLKRVFDLLNNKNLKCKIRPHPRFTNLEYIKTIFKDYFIEDTQNYSLAESLHCSYLTIALNSTVLSQAYYSNKPIVIDDYTNPQAFEELKSLDYIMIDKTPYFLTELLKAVEGKIESPIYSSLL